jgi:hypothetical protein
MNMKQEANNDYIIVFENKSIKYEKYQKQLYIVYIL